MDQIIQGVPKDLNPSVFFRTYRGYKSSRVISQEISWHATEEKSYHGQYAQVLWKKYLALRNDYPDVWFADYTEGYVHPDTGKLIVTHETVLSEQDKARIKIELKTPFTRVQPGDLKRIPCVGILVPVIKSRVSLILQDMRGHGLAHRKWGRACLQ